MNQWQGVGNVTRFLFPLRSIYSIRFTFLGFFLETRGEKGGMVLARLSRFPDQDEIGNLKFTSDEEYKGFLI